MSLESTPSITLSRRNRELREMLFECYVNVSMATELSGWLQELGLPSHGTLRHQLARLRQQAAALVLPAESFPRQTIYYLSHYDWDILSEICEQLGIPIEGSPETLFKRIYGEVGLREGWLRPTPEEARCIVQTFLPMLRNFGVVEDYSLDCMDDVSEVVDEVNAPFRSPLAFGSALIAVVIPELFQEAQANLLYDELKRRGVDLT